MEAQTKKNYNILPLGQYWLGFIHFLKYFENNSRVEQLWPQIIAWKTIHHNIDHSSQQGHWLRTIGEW